MVYLNVKVLLLLETMIFLVPAPAVINELLR